MKEAKNGYSIDCHSREGTMTAPVVSGRLYKDRVFRMVFKQKPYALSLYNAMNSTSYENPEEIQITTLDQSLYMNMKNDVSFVLHDLMSLYEHQSSYNPNMPLRDLFYVSKQYSVHTKNINLYGKQLVKIPEPKFVVFYNGVEPCPEYQKLRLSDAFLTKTENPQLELIVELYNINKGYNSALLEQCKPLRDYMIFVDKTRFHQQRVPIKDAVERAIEECIREDILSDFFRMNKAEVIEMSIFEYDEELHMRQERSSSFAEGKTEGREVEKIMLVLRNRDSFAIDMLAKIFDMEECEIEKILNLADQNPEKDANELLELMR